MNSIMGFAREVYQTYAALDREAVAAPLFKAGYVAPAIVALGVQTIGALPFREVVATITIADALFHYVASTRPELRETVKKYEKVLYWTHLAALTWSVGYLFQNLSAQVPAFPLTAESIFRTYLTNRVVSRFGGPYVRERDIFDRWLLSWPVALGSSYGLHKLTEKIHRWIDKDPINREELPQGMTVEEAEPSLPATPLWIGLLQQVTYVSLAIFSQSPWLFAVLSGCKGYMLYTSIQHARAVLRDVRISWSFQKEHIPGTFRYTERFSVRDCVGQEISNEVKRLARAVYQFQPFNFIQKRADLCHMCVYKMPSFALEQPRSKKISAKELHFEAASRVRSKCAFTRLDYKPKGEIAVPLQNLTKSSNPLQTTLGNGTIVTFPNIPTDRALHLKLEGKTITAQIESKKIKQGQLYLTCTTNAVPAAEKLSFTWSKKLRGNPFRLKGAVYIREKKGADTKCSACSATAKLFYYEECEVNSAVCKKCITSDFQRKIKEFTVVNGMNQIPKTSINEDFAIKSTTIYQFYADKEQLPAGSEFSATSRTEIDSSTEIIWLDYPIGAKTQARLNRYDDGTGMACGQLDDGTLILFNKVSPDSTQALIQAQTSINAQIVGKSVSENTLTLVCISRALPSKSMPLTLFGEGRLSNNTLITLQYKAELKPNLSDSEEDCMICAGTPEMLFYACTDKNHTACVPCWTGHLTTQVERLKPLNYTSRPEHRGNGQVVSTPHLYFDTESLPNCMHCRAPAGSPTSFTTAAEGVPAKVGLLNYKIDSRVQLNITGFWQHVDASGRAGVISSGTLRNGTLVLVTGLTEIAALCAKAFKTRIEATILKKFVENGRLCLMCEYISACQ